MREFKLQVRKVTNLTLIYRCHFFFFHCGELNDTVLLFLELNENC